MLKNLEAIVHNIGAYYFRNIGEKVLYPKNDKIFEGKIIEFNEFTDTITILISDNTIDGVEEKVQIWLPDVEDSGLKLIRIINLKIKLENLSEKQMKKLTVEELIFMSFMENDLMQYFTLKNLYFKSSLTFKEDFKVIDTRFIRNENSKRFKIYLKNQWNEILTSQKDGIPYWSTNGASIITLFKPTLKEYTIIKDVFKNLYDINQMYDSKVAKHAQKNISDLMDKAFEEGKEILKQLPRKMIIDRFKLEILI